MTARLDRAEWVWLAGLMGLSAVVGLTAGVDPRLAIAAALACGFVLLVFSNLAAGLAVFGFFSFLEFWAAGSVISVGKLGGILLALAWLAALVAREDERGDFIAAHPLVTSALGLLLGWSALSTAWAEDPSDALGTTGRYALNIILFLIVFTAVRTRRQALIVTAAFVAGAVTASIYGLVAGSGPPEIGERLKGTNLDPNELAGLLVSGLALSVALAANLRSPGLRLAAFAGGGFCLVGVFLTLSRGGMLALGAALLVAIIFGGRWRLRVVVVAMLISLVTVYYFAAIASPEARERITSTTEGQARVQEGRTTIWEIGWRMVEANPVAGVGAGNFEEASGQYLLQPGAITRSDQILRETPQEAHNSYLGVLAELGIVGLTLFATIIVFSFFSCLRAARNFQARGDPGGEALARGFAVALVGVLVANFFISQELNKQLWLLLGFGPTLLSISTADEPD